MKSKKECPESGGALAGKLTGQSLEWRGAGSVAAKISPGGTLLSSILTVARSVRLSILIGIIFAFVHELAHLAPLRECRETNTHTKDWHGSTMDSGMGGCRGFDGMRGRTSRMETCG
jgi:hypothetical protein